jgi:hypothetical protein
MTQGKINKFFESDLGQQLDVIYVTSDDQTFIRHEEAVSHTKDLLNANPESYVDTSISWWYPEFKDTQYQEPEKINFETAKLAKEKGYNEVCRSHFEEDGAAYDSYGNPFKPNDEQPHEILFARPTQTTLQRWLREKHKIIVIISFYNDGEEWEDTEYMVEVSEFKHFKTHDSFVKSNFTSYEQALEIGLQAALKLIK